MAFGLGCNRVDRARDDRPDNGRRACLGGLAAGLGGLALSALPDISARAAGDRASPADVARLLGGLPVSAGSPLAEVARQSGWASHARAMDAAYKDLERAQLPRIRAFVAANLKETRPTVVYPFSGPDALYAEAFFPGARTLVLAGLEPVGPVLDLDARTASGLAGSLPTLRHSLRSLMSYSFFRTKDMKEELSGHRLAGTLPILLAFLARAGRTVQSVSLVRITEAGEIEDAAGAKGPATAEGARITYTAAGEETARTLIYLRTDLSDSGMKKSGVQRYCEGLGEFDAFVKSASYLMHSDGFSRIRALLLDRAHTLLQDDSGVPLRHLEKARFDVRAFGTYTGPPTDVWENSYYQPALKELFRKQRAKPLDFGVGYRWRPSESSLLLARRPAAPA